MKVPGLESGFGSLGDLWEQRRERRRLRDEKQLAEEVQKEMTKQRLSALHEAIWSEWEPRLMERARRMMEEIDE